MRTSFLGRVALRDGLLTADDWRGDGPLYSMSLAGSPPGTRRYFWDSLAILIRGVINLRESTAPIDPERIATEIRIHYLETGTIPTDRLEGAFSIVLLDAATQRVRIYRNFAGTGPVYYRTTANGLVVGSNLADLALSELPQGQAASLPGETLFSGCRRVLPGEEILWDAGKLTWRPVEVLASPTPAGDFDSVLDRVMRDIGATFERPSTVLLGDPASQTMQEAYNRTIRTDLIPATYSPSFEVAGWSETDRAMTASRSLGTAHQLISVDDFHGDLRRWIERTGEIPSADEVALFRVAQTMQRRGHGVALAADTLDAAQPSGLWRRGLEALTTLMWTNREPVGPPIEQLSPTAPALWNSLGIDLVYPFLDSRMLSLVGRRFPRPARPPYSVAAEEAALLWWRAFSNRTVAPLQAPSKFEPTRSDAA